MNLKNPAEFGLRVAPVRGMLSLMPHPSTLALACFWLNVFCPPIQAQDVDDLDAIEKRIAEHVQKMEMKDPSTAGAVAAIEWEEQQWDALMNSAYQAMLARLPEEARKSFRASQRAWLAFRDAEFQAQLQLFSHKQGTMFVPMAAHARMLMVKHRATELASLVRIWRIDQE